MWAKSGTTLAGEFWGGRLYGVAGTLGFPLGRRVSLMLITMLVAAVGVNRTLLQRLLGGWAFLAFRREVFAATLPPSRRCRVNGSLLDELLLITGPASLLQTILRAEPVKSSTLQMHLRMALAAALRPSHRRPGWPSTIWPKRKENTCALTGKAKHHRATCTMGQDVFVPALQVQAHQPPWSWRA